MFQTGRYYSVKHKDRDVQRSSSSGGAFTALSDVILSHSGKIIGGGYNYSTHRVEFITCTTPEERDQLRGSKYIQSDLKDIFRQIKAEIELPADAKAPIMFVGTPCQVSGVKAYLEATGTDLTDLYLCDIVCHGVPSPGVWKDYIRKMFRGKQLEFVTFKDKRLGWKRPLAFAVVDGKEKSLRPYTLLYFGELISRPSCERCPYASLERVSDITIGDHWSVQTVDADFYSEDGVSLVFVNTEKGQKLFDNAAESIHYQERTPEQCLQPNLQRPTPANAKRSSFWQVYHRNANRAVFQFDLLVAAAKIRKRMMK